MLKMIKKSLLLAGLVGYVSAATDKAELWQMLQGNREAFAFKEEAIQRRIKLKREIYDYCDLLMRANHLMTPEMKRAATDGKDSKKFEEGVKSFAKKVEDTLYTIKYMIWQEVGTYQEDASKKRIKLKKELLCCYSNAIETIGYIFFQEIKRIDTTDEDIKKVVEKTLKDLEEDLSQCNIEITNILARIREQEAEEAATTNKDNKKAIEERLKLNESFLQKYTEIMDVATHAREAFVAMLNEKDNKAVLRGLLRILM